MKKHVKMILYGFPEDGKSTFASKAPNPFFIATDGNVEWLPNITEKNYVMVNSWEKAKATFVALTKPDMAWVETVVVDLTEDLFKWCEQEYCKRNRIDHVSDQAYGKAYDSTRSDYVNELSKLIALPKHVILIMHAAETTTKDRRGVEHTRFLPTDKLPAKVLDSLEGKMRYVLRCYRQAEEDEDGRLRTRRYLSLVPKENEFGIARGLDEDVVPHDIPLDWDTFAQVIGLDDDYAERKTTDFQKNIDSVPDVKPITNTPSVQKPVSTATAAPKQPVAKPTTTVAKTAPTPTKAVETPAEEKVVEAPKSTEPTAKSMNAIELLKAKAAQNAASTAKAPEAPAVEKKVEEPVVEATEAIAEAEEAPFPTKPATQEAPATEEAQNTNDVLAKLALLKKKAANK